MTVTAVVGSAHQTMTTASARAAGSSTFDDVLKSAVTLAHTDEQSDADTRAADAGTDTDVDVSAARTGDDGPTLDRSDDAGPDSAAGAAPEGVGDSASDNNGEAAADDVSGGETTELGEDEVAAMLGSPTSSSDATEDDPASDRPSGDSATSVIGSSPQSEGDAAGETDDGTSASERGAAGAADRVGHPQAQPNTARSSESTTAAEPAPDSGSVAQKSGSDTGQTGRTASTETAPHTPGTDDESSDGGRIAADSSDAEPEQPTDSTGTTDPTRTSGEPVVAPRSGTATDVGTSITTAQGGTEASVPLAASPSGRAPAAADRVQGAVPSTASSSSDRGSVEPTPAMSTASTAPPAATAASHHGAAAVSSAPAPPAPAAPTTYPQLQQQLARPLVALAQASPGHHTITLTVTPEHLGPVTVHAHVTGNGVHVELFAPNDAGRDAIRTLLTDLKRDFAGTGASGSLNLSDEAGPGANGQHDRNDQNHAPSNRMLRLAAAHQSRTALVEPPPSPLRIHGMAGLDVVL